MWVTSWLVHVLKSLFVIVVDVVEGGSMREALHGGSFDVGCFEAFW